MILNSCHKFTSPLNPPLLIKGEGNEMLKNTVISKKKIMVFCTFDGLHAGHLDFFRQARKLAPNSFLIVSVARDRNVFRIKGSLPVLNEKARRSLLQNCALVDKVALSGIKNHLPH